MLPYIFKRVLYFIPTCFFISLIIFFLSKAAGEYLRCESDPNGPDLEICKAEAREKGYDKPIFYITFSTTAHPDTLYKVFREERRNALTGLIGQYGNWPQINHYYQQLLQLEDELSRLGETVSSNGLTTMQKAVGQLVVKSKDKAISSQLKKLEKAAQAPSLTQLAPKIAALTDTYTQIKAEATPQLLWIPAINWYGFDNQYHFWITNFLKGDFGISHSNYQPVADVILDKLPWTLYINIPAIIIAYLLSVPLGVYSAVNKGSKVDKFISGSLLLLYSLPVFWVGTMLVNFFTTPEYGMKVFPSINFSASDSMGENIARLMLPIACVTYGALAFMTRQVRSSMIETLQADYIRTARAKGLPERSVVWKHAFKNALFPLITLFGSVFPAAFAGSVIVEIIFNITGMGWLLLKSIQSTDWPVVYAILMISAVLTMIGLLIADILYVVADPRVRLGKK
ncbi:MAG: ABC transporter permease [Bacteroidota bacterium]